MREEYSIGKHGETGPEGGEMNREVSRRELAEIISSTVKTEMERAELPSDNLGPDTDFGAEGDSEFRVDVYLAIEEALHERWGVELDLNTGAAVGYAPGSGKIIKPTTNIIAREAERQLQEKGHQLVE